MPRKSQREKNLAEAKHARRLVQQKVSRLEAKGVRVRKAEIAPVPPLSDLESMNATQLRSYIRSATRFNSRETSFVAGAQGEPLSAALVRQYMKLQAENNKRVEDLHRRVTSMGNLPKQSQTGLERRVMIANSRRAGATNPLIEKSFRTPNSFTSNKAVADLIKDMKDKVSGKFVTKGVGKRLNSVKSLLKISGMGDMTKEVESLSVDQQHFLFEFTNFAEIVGNQRYPKTGVTALINRNSELRYGTSEAEYVRADALTVLNWVKENTIASGTAPTKPTIPGKSVSPFVKGNASGRRRKR